MTACSSESACHAAGPRLEAISSRLGIPTPQRLCALKSLAKLAPADAFSA